MLKNHKSLACNKLAAQMCSANSERPNQSQLMVTDARNTMKLFVALYEGDEDFTKKRTTVFLLEQLSHLLPPLILESCRAGYVNEGQVNSPLEYIADEIQAKKREISGTRRATKFKQGIKGFGGKRQCAHYDVLIRNTS